MAKQRLVLVTGGASGIGEATTRYFGRRGDRVVIADVQEDVGRKVAHEIEAAGGSALYHEVDVAHEHSISRLADAIERTEGPVDVLVNSAGVLQNPSTIASLDLETHDRVWDINYRGTYLCNREWGPRMAERGGGSILNVCSTTSFCAVPLPAYAPSKMALISLTQIQACELGPRGVRVNGVAPGFCLTPAIKERIESGHRDPSGMKAMSALGRMIEPDDVARAIAFLCSDDASAITGVILPVDAGWLAGMAYREYPTKPNG